eukprot:6189436-Pleurochrysis_carterae.AAC.1
MHLSVMCPPCHPFISSSAVRLRLGDAKLALIASLFLSPPLSFSSSQLLFLSPPPLLPDVLDRFDFQKLFSTIMLSRAARLFSAIMLEYDAPVRRLQKCDALLDASQVRQTSVGLALRGRGPASGRTGCFENAFEARGLTSKVAFGGI